jgi:hypothetical protein
MAGGLEVDRPRAVSATPSRSPCPETRRSADPATSSSASTASAPPTMESARSSFSPDIERRRFAVREANWSASARRRSTGTR